MKYWRLRYLDAAEPANLMMARIAQNIIDDVENRVVSIVEIPPFVLYRMVDKRP